MPYKRPLLVKEVTRMASLDLEVLILEVFSKLCDSMILFWSMVYWVILVVGGWLDQRILERWRGKGKRKGKGKGKGEGGRNTTM